MDDAAPSDERYRPGGGIVLVPHSAAWTAAFEREASAIADALAELPIALHHVGSTAIPGIVAKPVIDMLGVVPAVEALDERAHRLAGLGYEALGELGIAGRRYFRKNAPDGARTHQLHAFAAGSPEIRRHVDFRDYLRAFPAEAAAYAALKRDLAGRCGSDVHAYSDGKTEFIRAVDRRAAAWRERAGRAAAADVGAGRARLTRARVRERWRELRDLVNAWDPIGVMDDPDWPPDEYECIVGAVLRRLEAGASADEIGAVLTRELEHHFGLRARPLQSHAFAERVVQWYGDRWPGSRAEPAAE